MTVRRQQPFFHERIPARDTLAANGVATGYLVDAGAGVVRLSDDRADAGQLYLVFDAGTGTYRLNDNAAGAELLAYFFTSSTVTI